MTVVALMLERLFNGLALSASGALPHDPTIYALAVATVLVWTAHFVLRRELEREVVQAEEREKHPR